MDDKKLYVQMLGGFSLTYDGKPVTLERNACTKATQLMQYLIYNKGKSIPRDKLIEILYSESDITNPQNNLKVNIFRLRKLLKESHLPGEEYIVYKSGMYSWRSSMDVEIDAFMFQHAADEAADFRRAADSRCALIEKAFDLYTGEFLPMVAAEPWAARESIKYRNTYLSCVQEGCELFTAQGNPEAALGFSTKATKLYPYEENLHLLRISSLLDMHLYQEALSAYDDASRRLLQDLGVSPSPMMLQLYRRITGNIRHSTAEIGDVKDTLRKDKPGEGAYYCNFPGFVDSYLFVSRLSERSGQSIYLMLSTLTDSHGVPLKVGEKLNRAAEDLQKCIYKSLRRSDLFTRYGPSQFVMLLTGINRESCSIVAQRVNAQFQKITDVRGVQIQHSFISGLDVDSD